MDTAHSTGELAARAGQRHCRNFDQEFAFDIDFEAKHISDNSYGRDGLDCDIDFHEDDDTEISDLSCQDNHISEPKSVESVSVSPVHGLTEKVTSSSRQLIRQKTDDSAPKLPLEYWPKEESGNPQVIWNILVQKYSKAAPAKMAAAIEYFNKRSENEHKLTSEGTDLQFQNISILENNSDSEDDSDTESEPRFMKYQNVDNLIVKVRNILKKKKRANTLTETASILSFSH